jgi:radical SAM protein with 4Fe4S-binding SPASM domain
MVRYLRSLHRHQDRLFVNTEMLNGIRRQLDTVRERYPDIHLEENLTGVSPTGVSPTGPPVSPAERRSAWLDRTGCGGGWTALGIAADGRAFLCEQMALREPFVVGDATRQSLREIWDSPRLRAFIFPPRDRFTGTPCSPCPVFEECIWSRGRCYRDAYYSYGSVHHPPPSCPDNSRPGLVMT